MEKEYLALLSLIAGACLGFFLDIQKEKRAQNVKWHEMYLNFSKEITVVLNPLLSLSLKGKSYTTEEFNKIKNEISQLYFKYYPFLPHDILLELNCMHSCLQSDGKRMYMIVGNRKYKTISQCKTTKEIKDLCRDATLINEGLDKLERIIDNGKLPVYLQLNFQARMVIRRIDVFFGNKKMFKWNKYLKKKTVYALNLK